MHRFLRAPMAKPAHLLALLLLAVACDEPTTTPEPTPAPAQSCQQSDVASLWTASRATKLEAALAELPGEWPTQLRSTVATRMQDNEPTWTASYAQACAAADNRAQRCLDLLAWQADALLSLLVDHGERAAELWAEVDMLVADPARCLELDEPSFDGPPLPVATGRELARIRLLLNLASDPQRGVAVHAELQDALDGLALDTQVTQNPGYALPLRASQAIAAFQSGDIEAAAAALDAANELGQRLGPRSQVSLAHVRGSLAFRRGDAEGGLLALREAVEQARAQRDSWLLLASLRNLGRVQVELRDFAGAVEPLAEAISLSTRLAGTDNPHTAELQVALSRAQLGQGQIEAAHDLLSQARDAFLDSLGPDHPQTLDCVRSIAQLLLAAGRPFEANYAYLDLLEIYGDLYGPKHLLTAQIKLELGETLMAMDQYESARIMYTEALAPLVQALGAGHRDVVRAAIHLGYAELALGHLDEAETHCRRGVDLVKGLAPEDPLAGEAQRCLTELAKQR